MSHILKSYYGDIFFEFLADKDNSDSIIILPGFPESGKDNEMMFDLYEKGFNVFRPRYRGSFQSKGRFLENSTTTDTTDNKGTTSNANSATTTDNNGYSENLEPWSSKTFSPVQGMKEFVEGLMEGEAVNLWNDTKVKFEPGNLHLVAGSFSGCIACGLESEMDSFSSITLFSPVWDFSKHNEEFDEQNLERLTNFVKKAYRNLYRFSFSNLKERMKKFDDLNPENYLDNLDTDLTVFHDPKDCVVSIEHSRRMVGRINGADLVEHGEGHGVKHGILEEHFENEVRK